MGIAKQSTWVGGWLLVAALSAVVGCDNGAGVPSGDPNDGTTPPTAVYPRVRVTVEFTPAGDDAERKRGNFIIELNDELAPLTSDNFLKYVDAKFYDGTVFHRVSDAPEVVQGGGYEVDPEADGNDGDFTSQPIVLKSPQFPNVESESSNGLKNIRGTVGLARQSDPDSGNAQWYINVQDNPGIDPLGNPPGFTVFGRVVGGMSLIDEISNVPTEARDPLSNVPVETVEIVKVERVGSETPDEEEEEEEVVEPTGPRVRVNVEYTTAEGERTSGSFVIGLYEYEAPLSVANFLSYVDAEFYPDTVIHRVDTGLGVVQGGGFIVDEDEDSGDGDLTSQPLELKPALFDGVTNEADNGLLNVRASVGVARTSDPDSGNSQWYVNTVDNPGLDPESNPPGYAIFGRVIEGMDVVDEIQDLPTEARGDLMNVPIETVVVTSIDRIE